MFVAITVTEVVYGCAIINLLFWLLGYGADSLTMGTERKRLMIGLIRGNELKKFAS